MSIESAKFEDVVAKETIETINLDIEIDTNAFPTILVDTPEKSKMEAATEVIRESSPRSKIRPKLSRQNSAEMQLAVEVQRPIVPERKPSTSLSIPNDDVDTFMAQTYASVTGAENPI